MGYFGLTLDLVSQEFSFPNPPINPDHCWFSCESSIQPLHTQGSLDPITHREHSPLFHTQTHLIKSYHCLHHASLSIALKTLSQLLSFPYFWGTSSELYYHHSPSLSAHRPYWNSSPSSPCLLICGAFYFSHTNGKLDFQQSSEFKLTPEVNLTQVAELVALTWAFKLAQNKKDDKIRKRGFTTAARTPIKNGTQIVSLWEALLKEWSILKITVHNNSQTFTSKANSLTGKYAMIAASQENFPSITGILPIAQPPLETEILRNLGHINCQHLSLIKWIGNRMNISSTKMSFGDTQIVAHFVSSWSLTWNLVHSLHRITHQGKGNLTVLAPIGGDVLALIVSRKSQHASCVRNTILVEK